MSRNPAWTEPVIAKLRELWAAGVSTPEIGRRLGFTKNQVVGKTHTLGFEPRPSAIIPKGTERVAISQDDTERIQALHSAGHGYKAIHKITGISDFFVRRALGYRWPESVSRTVEPAAPLIRAVKPVFSAPAPIVEVRQFSEAFAGQCQWLEGSKPYVQCTERALAGEGVSHPWSYCCAHRARAFVRRAA